MMDADEYVVGYDKAIDFLQAAINDGWHTKETLLEKLGDELE